MRKEYTQCDRIASDLDAMIRNDIQILEEKQAKALDDYEEGVISETERDVAIQLAYEKICELDPGRKEQ